MTGKIDAAKAAADSAAQKSRFVVLGVNRRDLLFLGSFTDGSEAEAVAAAGVTQSKFSDTFVLDVSAHFTESAVNWKNPDGVSHEPAQGAPLNPEAEEQESAASEKTSDVPEVSKRDVMAGEAERQIKDGTAIDTGEPDKRNAAKDGHTSAFDSAAKADAKKG